VSIPSRSIARRIATLVAIGGSTTLGPCSPSRSVSSSIWTRKAGRGGVAPRFQSWIRSSGRPSSWGMKGMIGAALRGCQRRGLAPLVLAIALVLLPCGARPAWALADWFGVEASAFDNSLTGTGAIDDNGLPGTEFDFKDTLGIDDHDTATQA